MNKNVHPYYDDSKTLYDKNYKEILFNPGRPVQARELTQIQGLNELQTIDNLNTLYKNGSIVEGCVLSIVIATKSTIGISNSVGTFVAKEKITSDNVDPGTAIFYSFDNGTMNLEIISGTFALGDTISNGDSSGIAVTNGDSEILPSKCYTTIGQFYFDGRIHKIIEQEIEITGSGDEVLGFKLTETVIDSSADADLKDPANGSINYGLDGADRLKQEFTLVLDDADMVSLWNLKDGVLQEYVRRPDYSELIKVLAKRTHDESGNYLVDGMKLGIEDHPTDSTKLVVTVTSGSAYVMGYEAAFPVNQRIIVDKPQNTNTVSNDPYVFSDPWVYDVEVGTGEGASFVLYESVSFGGAGTPNAMVLAINTDVLTVRFFGDPTGDLPEATDTVDGIDRSTTPGDGIVETTVTTQKYSTGSFNYTLSEPYVESVGDGSDVNTVARNVGITINHSSAGGTDTYTDMSLTTSVLRVWDATTEYVESTDYTVEPSGGNKGAINWSPGGAEPGTGSDYYITIEYSATLIDPNHFTTAASSTAEYTDIVLDGTQTSFIHGNSIFVDYAFYQSRSDKVIVNSNGTISVITGQNVHHSDIVIPDASQNVLSLGWIKMAPNSLAEKAGIHNFTYNRTTMLELFETKERVSLLEENQTEIAIESQAISDEDNLLLRGVFIDDFRNFAKTDIGNIEFGCGMNSIYGVLSLPWKDEVGGEVSKVSFDYNNNVYVNTEEHLYDDITYVSLSRTSEEAIIENLSRTDQSSLNPYDLIEIGSFTLNPSGDFVENDIFIDRTIENTVERRVTTRFDRSTELPDGAETNRIFSRRRRRDENDDDELNVTPPERIVGNLGFDEVDVNTSISLKSERDAVFAREITITVKGKDWRPLSILSCEFDGVDVPLTGISGYSEDGDDNIVCDINGAFEATFDIPANSLSGNHDVFFKDVINPNIQFNQTYIAGGRERVFDRITTITTFVEPAPIPRNFDPIAQSFVIENDRTYSSVDVYFSSKPSNDDPAFLQIGYVIDGYPNSNRIFHRQNILPDDVTELTGNPTNIEFEIPIHVPADASFFVSFGAVNTDWKMFFSTLGYIDVNTDTLVTKQTYLDGNMFNSANNETWTALQFSDITLSLYNGRYEETGSVVTENMTSLDFSHFLVNSSTHIVPNGCSINYYYSLDNGVTWVLFVPDLYVKLDTAYTQLKLKYVLNGDTYNTPLVNIDPMMVQLANLDADGAYISKNIDGLVGYDSVKIIMDTYTPSGTSFTPAWSADDGETWIPFDGSSPDESYEITDTIFNRQTWFVDFGTDDDTVLQKISWDTALFSAGDFVVGDTITQTATSASGTLVFIDTVTKVLVIDVSSDPNLFNVATDITNGSSDLDLSGDTSDLVENLNNGGAGQTNFRVRIDMATTNAANTPSIRKLKCIMRTN